MARAYQVFAVDPAHADEAGEGAWGGPHLKTSTSTSFYSTELIQPYEIEPLNPARSSLVAGDPANAAGGKSWQAPCGWQASPGTAGDLCNLIYGSTTAALTLGLQRNQAMILRMAQELVEQHLEDLQERGRVTGSADFFGRRAGRSVRPFCLLRTWWEAKLVPAM